MRWHRFFSSLPKLLQVGLLPNGLTRAAQYHNAHRPPACFRLLGITEECIQDEDDFTPAYRTAETVLYLVVLRGFCQRTNGGRHEKTNGGRQRNGSSGGQCAGRRHTPDNGSRIV